MTRCCGECICVYALRAALGVGCTVLFWMDDMRHVDVRSIPHSALLRS